MMGAEQKDMIDFDTPDDDLLPGKPPPSLAGSPSKELDQASSKDTSLLDIETDQEEPSIPAEPAHTSTDAPNAEEQVEDDQEFGTFDTMAAPAPSPPTTIEQDGEDDGFDDIDTANTESQNPFTSINTNDAEDDEFGDFGGAPVTSAAATTDPTEDDDFGDFGGAPVADGGDDDFGDFGDFGEVQQTVGGGGSSDEFGDFGDFTQGTGGDRDDAFGDFEQGTTDTATAEGSSSFDAFGDESEVATAESAVPVQETEPAIHVEVAPDFNAVNSRQVENYVLAQLEKIFPLEEKDKNASEQQQQDQKELLALYDTESGSSILAEQELWRMLCEQSMHGVQGSKSPSTAPQFQWKYSHLRKEYYASLGLAAVNEQTAVPASSIPGHVASGGSTISSPTLSSKSRTSSPLILAPDRMPGNARRTLDIPGARAFCNFTRESLGGYSGDEMKEIIARLTELTKHASEELTYWLDQREQMAMDSERYNGMIASLVGRAAKLKESEAKQASKSKRLTRSSFNLMSSS